jgi:hypothetical protein
MSLNNALANSNEISAPATSLYSSNASLAKLLENLRVILEKNENESKENISYKGQGIN